MFAEWYGDDEVEKLTAGVAVVITAAWAVSFVVDVFNEGYEPPASVHALMLLVAGALFGDRVLRARKDD